MNDTFEFWLVEQYVDLGNEMFWHEKARLFCRVNASPTDKANMLVKAHRVGVRDIRNHGGRYRIRVVKEETLYDSEKEIGL